MNQAMAFVLTVALLWAIAAGGCAPDRNDRFFNPRDLYGKLDKQAPLNGDDHEVQSER